MIDLYDFSKEAKWKKKGNLNTKNKKEKKTKWLTLTNKLILRDRFGKTCQSNGVRGIDGNRPRIDYDGNGEISDVAINEKS